MNPLANIDFTQANLDQIAGALNNRPREEVYRLLNEKAAVDLTFAIDEKCANYSTALQSIGSFAIAAAIATILMLVLTATVVKGGVMLTGTTGGALSTVTITALIIIAVCYSKYKKQNIGTNEIKRKLANGMRTIYQRRQCNHLGREIARTSYHITQQENHLLDQYFGNQQPIIVN